MALLAAGMPALLAYNLPPSATLFNQTAAVVGWAAFSLLALTGSARPSAIATRALFAVYIALGATATVTAVELERHESLALSMLGTLVAVAVMLSAGAAVRRNGRATTMAGAVCVGLLGVAVISTGVSLMQVFAPSAIDGVWIAASSLPGRAVGNLRQPNHLSSLLLWALIAAAALRQGRSLSAAQAIALAGLISFGIVLTASRTGA